MKSDSLLEEFDLPLLLIELSEVFSKWNCHKDEKNSALC